MSWRLGLLAAAVVSAVALWTTGVVEAHALLQADSPTPGSGGTDLGALFSNPGKWATEVFNQALLSLGKSFMADTVGFLETLLGGSGNVISSTPPSLSYELGIVTALHDKLRAVANIALGGVTVWGAFNLIVNPHIRAPYHGALELVPRLVVGAVLVNSSLGWGRFTIDLSNEVCRWVGFSGVPGWDAVRGFDPGTLLVNVVIGVVYLVMGLLLEVQMLTRLALIDTLLIVAPLALVCWVLPQTTSWARLWFQTFFATVFVQVVQIVVLRLGGELIGSLIRQLPEITNKPFDTAGQMFSTLIFGLAVLQLARKVPRLMPGYPGGNETWGTLRAFASRQLFAAFSGGGHGRRPRR
jgi:hypothetical protein